MFSVEASEVFTKEHIPFIMMGCCNKCLLAGKVVFVQDYICPTICVKCVEKSRYKQHAEQLCSTPVEIIPGTTLYANPKTGFLNECMEGTFESTGKRSQTYLLTKKQRKSFEALKEGTICRMCGRRNCIMRKYKRGSEVHMVCAKCLHMPFGYRLKHPCEMFGQTCAPECANTCHKCFASFFNTFALGTKGRPIHNKHFMCHEVVNRYEDDIVNTFWGYAHGFYTKKNNTQLSQI